MFKNWHVSGFTDILGEWVPTYSNYYTWVRASKTGNLLDYYVVAYRGYKKGYTVSIYVSSTNNTELLVSSAKFENQKECTNWVSEEIQLFERCPERLEVLCRKIFNTKKATVYKKENEKITPFFSMFHGHYMGEISKICGRVGDFIYDDFKTKWIVSVGGWGHSCSTIN